MKNTNLIIFLVLFSKIIFSQEDSLVHYETFVGSSDKSHKKEIPLSPGDKLRAGTTVRAVIIGNDTVPVVNLPVFRILDVRNFKSKKDEKNYFRLKRDVMKVYPYARLAGDKLRLYNDTLVKFPNDKLRKKYLKKVEQSLKDEFTEDIENMTVNQGRILIRLIDRQTGNTSYHLLEELRGTFSAFFWQSIARLFGQNLKTRYNPREGEDKIIEEIVLLIDSGDFK